MQLEKEIKLTAIDGKEITFTLKTVLSAYDSEQIERFYIETLYPPDTGEFDDPEEKEKYIKKQLEIRRTEMIYGFGDRKLEVVVKSWSKDEPLTPENVKRSLKASEFSELMKEVNAIVDENDIGKKKNNGSENSSSKPSPTTKM